MGLVWYSCTTAFQYDNVSTEWLVTIRLLISGIILLIISSFGTRKRDIWHLETKSDAIKMILFGLFGMLAVQYTYFLQLKRKCCRGNIITIFSSYIHHCILTFQMERSSIKIDFISITLSLVGTFLLLTNGSVHNLAVSTPAIIWGILSGLSLAFIVYIQRNC